MSAPIDYDFVELDPDEDPPDHEFASTDRYKSDLSLLNYLLQDLRVLVRRYAKGEMEIAAHDVIAWEVHGLQRRTVMCDPDRLLDPGPVYVVGFFGDRRDDADQRPIDASEFDLIDEFRSYPGILSYSSTELVDRYWSNLVVHTHPDDRESWRHSQRHIDAVDHVAPEAYHSVRIHNGFIRDGVAGSRTVNLVRSKYWDYDCDPVWVACRELPGGQSESLTGPAT